MDPVEAAIQMEPITFVQFLRVSFLCVIWSTIIGAIIEGIKKGIDTEVDPETKAGVEIIAETVRGRPPVTPELMEAITSGEVTLIDEHNHGDDFNLKIHRDSTGKEVKYYKRPVWFRRILPILPMMFGLASGPAVLAAIVLLSGIVLPTKDPMVFYSIGGFMGLGSGSMSGNFYKAWDSMGGAYGILKFFAEMIKRLRDKVLPGGAGED
jgi:hypothetical protein